VKTAFKKAIVIGTSCLVLISGCQQVNELRVLMSGSSIPSNHREKVIFDYFHALQQMRYQDAYRLRDPEARGTYESFLKDNSENHNRLPVRISIGGERKIDGTDANCGYHYTVYVADPESSRLVSGEVYLIPNREEPGSCQVSYNSAFGSL
jgi:hypothetical protein